jgi:hypothetical protein
MQLHSLLYQRNRQDIGTSCGSCYDAAFVMIAETVKGSESTICNSLADLCVVLLRHQPSLQRLTILKRMLLFRAPRDLQSPQEAAAAGRLGWDWLSDSRYNSVGCIGLARAKWRKL